MYYVINEPYLMHYGIKGQKWGIRKYQNPDGTLTDAGKARYLRQETKRLRKEFNESRGHKISRKDERGARLKYIEKHYKGDFHDDVDAANRYALSRKRKAVNNTIMAALFLSSAAVTFATLEDKRKTDKAAYELYNKKMSEQNYSEFKTNLDNIDQQFNDQQVRYINNKAVANLSRTGSAAKTEATKEMLRAYSNMNRLKDDAKENYDNLQKAYSNMKSISEDASNLSTKKFIKKYSD